MFGSEEGTKPSERSEQDMQRDKGTHDHMRETGLTVVTRRSLRALTPCDSLHPVHRLTRTQRGTHMQAKPIAGPCPAASHKPPSSPAPAWATRSAAWPAPRPDPPLRGRVDIGRR